MPRYVASRPSYFNAKTSFFNLLRISPEYAQIRGGGFGGGGEQEGSRPSWENLGGVKLSFLPLHLADLARRQLANWSLQIENWVLFTGFLT